MAEKKDYYEVLGVSKTASQDEFLRLWKDAKVKDWIDTQQRDGLFYALCMIAASEWTRLRNANCNEPVLCNTTIN